MRETNFIKQNKEKWAEFETILKQPRKNPDKLSELFVQLSDDLSYSRTFYPNRSVKLYLNNLTQQVFNSLYKNKKEGWKKFWFFWREELPLLVYSCRKEFLISFLVFLLSFGIGVISAANDPDFPQQILGKEYVRMTIENINSGDPMRVYKEAHQTNMFLGITFNNLRVSFFTFLSGIVASIGTIGMLMYNGIMVGTFQYFFYEMESAHPGVLKQSLLTIWMHGTLEISSIIIAGAAGIVLGKGMLFPGTYTRLQAFQVSARKGLKIMIGISPIIMFAAFIESFVTRYTDVPDIMRIAVIGISLMFIIGYFVIYPITKHRSGASLQQFEYRLPPTASNNLEFNVIKNTGEIFSDIFIFYRKFFKKIFLVSFGTSIIATILLYAFFKDTFTASRNLSFFYVFGYVLQLLFRAAVNVFNTLIGLFSYDNFIWLLVLNSVFFSFIIIFIFQSIINLSKNKQAGKNKWLNYFFNYFKTFIPVIFINYLLVLLPNFFGFMLFFFLLPFFLLWSFISQAEGKNLFSGIKQLFALLTGPAVGRLLGTYLMCSLISFILFFLAASPLLGLYLDVMTWNLSTSAENTSALMGIALNFVVILTLMLMIIPIISLGVSFLYFSLKEIKEAPNLEALVDKFGTKKKRLLFGNEG